MKRPCMKKVLCGAVVLSLAVFCMACSPGENASQQNLSQTSGEATDEATTQASYRPAKITENESWEKNWSEYPDQVESFFGGVDRTENTLKTMSHSRDYANFNAMCFDGFHGDNPLADTDVYGYCLICHSSLGNEIIEKEGIAGLQKHTLGEFEGEIDFFDCALCHENGQPGAAVTMGAGAKYFVGDVLDDVDMGIAVCAQCHNLVSDEYPNRLSFPVLWDKLMSGELAIEDVQPYRYGIDPDSIRRAMLEDGWKGPAGMGEYDEASGTTLVGSNDPEFELFMGSAHEQAGLTCVDCHMVSMTNEDGQPYTSHNASSTPLESEEALEFCLTCHSDSSQTTHNASTTDEMRQVVLSAEEEVAGLQMAFNEKRAALYTALCDATANGGVDETALEEAREAYARAVWYVEVATDQQGQNPGANTMPDTGHCEVSGVHIAHNPETVRSYIVDATQWCEDALAALA